MTEPPVTWSVEALRANEAWLRPLVRTLVDDGAANDVLQETWLRAWRSPPRARGALPSWLATVARNLALTHRRAEQRRRRHETAGAAAGLDPTEQSTDATVERLALQRAVSQAVVDLPEPLRTAILLHHFHGLDVATIAERTGTTHANVRQRLHRGREWLRERLAQRLGEPWRRSPAVAALLAGGPALPPPSLAHTAPPLLFAMTKVRLVVAALLVGSLLAVPLLAPLFADPALERREAHAAPVRTEAVNAPAGNGPSETAPAANDAPRVAAAGAPAGTAAAARGRVLDVRGRPVAGAVVAWLRGTTFEPDDVAVSGADGEFSWHDPAAAAQPVFNDGGEPAVRRLAVREPWLELAVRPAGPDGAPALLVVAPCRAQALRVVDPAGTPLRLALADLRVTALLDFPSSLEDTVQPGFRTVAADADGRCRWARAPLVGTALEIVCAGHRPARIALDASTPAELLVTLTPLRDGVKVLRGTVTDARGAWVRDALVVFGEQRTQSGAHGEYVIALDAGERFADATPLVASAPGWFPVIVRDAASRLRTTADGTLVQDLQLTQPPLELAGRVIDHRGDPLAGVFVYPWQLEQVAGNESAEDLASPPDSTTESFVGNELRAVTRTDANGRFLLRCLADREYRLRVRAPTASWGFTSEPVRAGTPQLELRIPRTRGPVAGRLVTRDGAPAADVELHGFVGVYANGGGHASEGIGLSTRTDADGRFRIPDTARLGVQLAWRGEQWIDGALALDEAPDPENLHAVVLRRCHVRVECTGKAWANGSVQFLDAQGQPVMLTERRRSTVMSNVQMALHDGRTGVLAIAEDAATMVVRTANGEREHRVPVALRPGAVNTITSPVE